MFSFGSKFGKGPASVVPRVARILVLLVQILGLVEGLHAQALRTELLGGREVAAGEILVRFRNRTVAESRTLAAQDADLSEFAPAGGSGALVLRSRNRNTTALLQTYRVRPDVEYAEPNYIWQPLAVPNDAFSASQYALQNTGQTVRVLPGTAGADIKAVEAWDRTQGSRGIVTAVVDSGIFYTHPDLAQNVWSAPSSFTFTVGGQTITCPAGSHGFNVFNNTCDPMEDDPNDSHGTAVSGVLGATGNNGIGISGVSPVSSILAIKAFNSARQTTTAQLLTSIDFAIRVKAVFGISGNVRIINCSWGTPSFSQALLDEINLANLNDMMVVAGAGNNQSNNDSAPFYPASYNAPNVISVAATDNRDQLAIFSNFGASSVHLAAPGADVLTTMRWDVYQFLDGTSLATPMVSGAAALVLSSCNLTTSALKSALLSSVDAVSGLSSKLITGGRLNVSRALSSCAPSSGVFTLSAVPGTPAASPGTNANIGLTIGAIQSFSGTVSLAATGLPPGMTATFNPSSVGGGAGTSTLTLTTSAVTPGTYPIGIKATSAALTRTAAVSLTIGGPTIYGIEPAGGIAGTTTTVRIVGTGLENGATAVTFGGSGIGSTIQSTQSSDLIEGLPVTLSIADTVPTSSPSVTVSTTAGTSIPFSGFQVVNPIPISLGQSISSALSLGDPRDYLNPESYAEYYAVTLSTTTEVTIDMKALNLNSYVRLLTASGLDWARDDNRGGGTNGTDAHLKFSLFPGTWYIVATTPVFGASGTYTLYVNALPQLDTVSPAFMALGTTSFTTVTGKRLTTPLDLEAADAGVQVSVVTPVSDTVVTAAVKPVTGKGLRHLLVGNASGPSNPISFWVFPTIPIISLGDVVSGSLSSTDGTSPYSQNQYADVYKMTISTLASGTSIVMKMSSTALYTRVYLVSSSGSVLASDSSSILGQDAEARSAPLSAGNYFILATSLLDGVTGAYTLSAAAVPNLTGLAPAFGARGATVDMALGGDRLFPGMTVNAGSGIVVSNVQPFSTFKAAVATFGIAGNAELGVHNVTVTTGEGTSNGLKFSVFPTIPNIAAGQTVTGHLGTGSGRDPVGAFPPFFVGNYADLYQITLDSTVQLSIHIQTAAFSPTLSVLSPNGTKLDTAGNIFEQSNGSMTLRMTLSSGNYYIDVTSSLVNVDGDYTLSVFTRRRNGQITSQ